MTATSSKDSACVGATTTTTAGAGIFRALLGELDGWKQVIARALVDDLAPRDALEMIVVIQIIWATILLEELARNRETTPLGDPASIRAQAAASRTLQAN